MEAVGIDGRKDPEIIAAVLDGDTEAFAALVQRHQAKLLAFCRSMLGSGGEDAAQEVFVKAFTALPDFRLDASFSTWLYRIAYNHCCTIIKRNTRAATDSLDAMPETEKERAMRAPAPAQAGGEAETAAARAMAELPGNYRAVMAMRLDGQDYRSIALALGISEDSVRARLRRARLILRSSLRHFFKDTGSKV
jgi:RNA polymerase sigma-70 factor (ECF subfamily)